MNERQAIFIEGGMFSMSNQKQARGRQLRDGLEVVATTNEPRPTANPNPQVYYDDVEGLVAPLHGFQVGVPKREQPKKKECRRPKNLLPKCPHCRARQPHPQTVFPGRIKKCFSCRKEL